MGTLSSLFDDNSLIVNMYQQILFLYKCNGFFEL